MEESYDKKSDNKFGYKEDWTTTYYDTADYISGPKKPNGGTIPSNILQFHYSFGYDCRKYYNLCVVDSTTLAFASGNLIHFLDVTNGKMWFRRGSTGGGIGHICKNPTFDHIAVGENGINPPIIVYLWPTMDIITILLEGTTSRYAHLAYSPDGLSLISQGGAPDYVITIWNWRESKIVLRCKSYGQDVYNVMYSASIPGHLVTCGAGHIKFWKIAKTFTGLKLKGQLGRFGKTEISDIFGIYLMPDEKVVSSCEWGNMLIWDEGKIKVEVRLKGGEPCHLKPIAQFEHVNGELISMGMDGSIRMWFYETIDLADPPDENRLFEISPICEFKIAENIGNYSNQNSMIMCMQKREPNNPENTIWYAQDGNGGLWQIDLNTFSTAVPSVGSLARKILSCHAGPIIDMAVADYAPFVATLGFDGRLNFYNFYERRLILIHQFHDVGSQVLWFPCKAEPTGSTLVCAFQSGFIRMIVTSIVAANADKDVNKNYSKYVRVIHVLKPHKSIITSMSLNASCSVLVTGSLDSTIFAFSVCTSELYIALKPIGFVSVSSGVTCMTWNPKRECTLLIGCLYGEVVEIELPEKPPIRTVATYELLNCASTNFKFHSVKSYIIREEIRLKIEKQKDAKQTKMREKLQQLKSNNPDMEIDAETLLMDTEEYPPLPDIYVPKVPNKVLMVKYTEYNTIWLSIAGYDAGYVYEYLVPASNRSIKKQPDKSIIIQDADNAEVRTCLLWQNKYLFMGMEHGEIRICKVEADYTDFSDYWMLPMHDYYNGCIPSMLFSYDQKILLTCGYDGNLFSFEINDNEALKSFKIPTAEDPKPLVLR